MNKIMQLLALAGSTLVIASYQNSNDVSALLTSENALVDTVPKGHKHDSMHVQWDTTMARYIDLKTGQPIELYYDPKARRTYSVMNNEPVDWYVNTTTGDTIYGRGRYVVNNYIVRTSDGYYKLDESKIKMDKDDLKMKDGDKKFKMEKKGMKIKNGDQKMKTDKGETKMN